LDPCAEQQDTIMMIDPAHPHIRLGGDRARS